MLYTLVGCKCHDTRSFLFKKATPAFEINILCRWEHQNNKLGLSQIVVACRNCSVNTTQDYTLYSYIIANKYIR